MSCRCSRHQHSGMGKTWVVLWGCLALTILPVFFLFVHHQQTAMQSVGRALWGAVQMTTGHLVHGGQYPALSLSPCLQCNSPSPLPSATLALPLHWMPPCPPPMPMPAMKMSAPSIQHQQPVPSSHGDQVWCDPLLPLGHAPLCGYVPHVRFSLYYLGFVIVFCRVIVTYIVALSTSHHFPSTMFLITLPILFYLPFQSFMYFYTFQLLSNNKERLTVSKYIHYELHNCNHYCNVNILVGIVAVWRGDRDAAVALSDMRTQHKGWMQGCGVHCKHFLMFHDKTF